MSARCASRRAGASPGFRSSYAARSLHLQPAAPHLHAAAADLLRALRRLVHVRASTLATAAGSPLLHKAGAARRRSEEHTSELQSRLHLVCRLLLEKKKKKKKKMIKRVNRYRVREHIE